MLSIDLNCDIGESTSLWLYNIKHDLSLLPFLSSINIACGVHAGDPDTGAELIKAAVPLNISIGAHPSFPDRENFGRREMIIEESELYKTVYEQLEFMGSLALKNGARMQHVKPHGALYNMAAKDHRMAFIICSAIHAYDEDLIVYGLSGGELVKVADTMGLKSCNEVFADRRYQPDGSLTPRSQIDALINDETESIEQVLRILIHGKVSTAQGQLIPLRAETICIHSDGQHAYRFAKNIHDSLRQHGIGIFHP